MTTKPFSIDDLITIYESYHTRFNQQSYKYISKILADAKPEHLKTFEGKDHEQSWRAFKGKNLEKLIVHIIKNEVEKLGLKIILGHEIERRREDKLTIQMAQVRRNLLIDYGEFGYHLPDVDMVIYDPNDSKVIAVLSSKVTLRERIAQSGYWKLKLLSQPLTKHIKVCFVTPDEDNLFADDNQTKKPRAIAEMDLDCSYVLSEAEVKTSNKVKLFEYFVGDLKKLR